jgi:hypothetical protein
MIDKRAPQEPASPVTRRQKIHFARIEEVAVPPTVDAPLDWIIPVVKVPGLRIYDRVNDPPDLLALAPFAARWAEYRYVAAVETSRERGAGRDIPKADRRFRLSVAWSRTASDARQVMAWLMTRYSEPLKPMLGPAGQRLGDVAFASARMRAVFLVRGNVFVRVVSTGRAPASAEPLARGTDSAILRASPPPSDEPKGQRPAGRPPSGQSGA